MKIAGLIKSSVIDYPGKIAAVVFLQGCNFRCGFCHNPDLIPLNSKNKCISQNELMDFLKNRVGKLDAVVITGGEPTLNADLINIIKGIKELGYLIKLDTNGSNPTVTQELIESDLVDYLAMDIKGRLTDYQRICGYSNTKIIQKSVEIIMNSKVEYEFRTTVLPFYHSIDDFKEIGQWLNGAKKFTVQEFRPQVTLLTDLKTSSLFTKEDLDSIKNVLDNYIKVVKIHKNLA